MRETRGDHPADSPCGDTSPRRHPPPAARYPRRRRAGIWLVGTGGEPRRVTGPEPLDICQAGDLAITRKAQRTKVPCSQGIYARRLGVRIHLRDGGRVCDRRSDRHRLSHCFGADEPRVDGWRYRRPAVSGARRQPAHPAAVAAAPARARPRDLHQPVHATRRPADAGSRDPPRRHPPVPRPRGGEDAFGHGRTELSQARPVAGGDDRRALPGGSRRAPTRSRMTPFGLH